jgi:hypothetical protein
MKKLLLLMTIVCSTGKCPFTGNLFLYRKNITNYDFKDASGLQSPDLQAGSGTFYETGYAMSLNNEKIKYAIGLSLNEYNAIGRIQPIQILGTHCISGFKM